MDMSIITRQLARPYYQPMYSRSYTQRLKACKLAKGASDSVFGISRRPNEC